MAGEADRRAGSFDSVAEAYDRWRLCYPDEVESAVAHVSGGAAPGFVADSHPVYLQCGLSDDPAFALPAPGQVQSAFPEIDESTIYPIELPRLMSWLLP